MFVISGLMPKLVVTVPHSVSLTFVCTVDHWELQKVVVPRSKVNHGHTEFHSFAYTLKH